MIKTDCEKKVPMRGMYFWGCGLIPKCRGVVKCIGKSLCGIIGRDCVVGKYKPNTALVPSSTIDVRSFTIDI